MKRLYNDVPIWMRPTDWENTYGPAAYENYELNILRDMRKLGYTFIEIGKEMGISGNRAAKLYRTHFND